ncbi:MAG: ABC transporter substrate-binding protein, partial [Pseudomonadota bacterium]
MTEITRRKALTLGAGAGAVALSPARFAQAQTDAPIKIGFQVHRTGIGAAYGRWYDRTTQAAVAKI